MPRERNDDSSSDELPEAEQHSIDVVSLGTGTVSSIEHFTEDDASDAHSVRSDEDDDIVVSRQDHDHPPPEQRTQLGEGQEVGLTLSDSSGDSNDSDDKSSNPVKLYKSSRLKSYITLTLASFINYDAAVNSSNVTQSAFGGVPSTSDQRAYAVAVSTVSLAICGGAVVMHLDRLTPLERIWIRAFKPKSRIELAVAAFLVIWWTIGTGIQTSLK